MAPFFGHIRVLSSPPAMAALANILDRFLHGGVVDYIYWHYGFDFPIFNFADIIIDCGIVLFIWQALFSKTLKTTNSVH